MIITFLQCVLCLLETLSCQHLGTRLSKCGKYQQGVLDCSTLAMTVLFFGYLYCDAVCTETMSGKFFLYEVKCKVVPVTNDSSN